MSHTHPDRPFAIHVEHRDGVAIVTLGGACTMDISARLHDQLAKIVAQTPHGMVVDMAGLDFIDSTGIGAIVSAYVSLRRHNGAIRLVNPQPVIREILEITRLIELFSIESSVAAALAALR